MLMLLLVHYMWMYIPALMICIDPIDASHVFIIQLPIKALFIDFKMDVSINSYDNKKCESLIINEYMDNIAGATLSLLTIQCIALNSIIYQPY